MSAPMFSLTELTGREASAHRTVVIGTVEMNWRVWMILLWGLAPALLVTAVLFIFVGSAGLLAIPLVEGAALYLIHRRTRTGLRLRTYQAVWDKKKSSVNTFFVCGQPIDLAQDRFVSLIGSTVPNPNYVAPEATSSLAQSQARRHLTPVPSGIAAGAAAGVMAAGVMAGAASGSAADVNDLFGAA